MPTYSGFEQYKGPQANSRIPFNLGNVYPGLTDKNPGNPVSDPYPGSPLGRGGPAGLRDILGMYFLPEYQRTQGKRNSIEDAFLGQAETPGSLYGAASTAATGYAQDLFKPGGQIAQLIAKARGQSIGQGFAPSGAEGSERAILAGGVNSVGNVFAQNAAQLEGQRFGTLAQYTEAENQGTRDLLESLFTGVGTAEQLNMTKQASKKRFLGLF